MLSKFKKLQPFNFLNFQVACIYNDHSLYVWDVVNVRRVGKAWSFLYHSGCIWALEVCGHCFQSFLLSSNIISVIPVSKMNHQTMMYIKMPIASKAECVVSECSELDSYTLASKSEFIDLKYSEMETHL